MKITITGRRLEVTEGIRNCIYKKLGKLEKFFQEEPEVQATLSVEKERQTVEVTIFSKGVIYRAEETDPDLYMAIDRVVDIIERQMRKHKTHLEKKLKKEPLQVPYKSIHFEKEEPEEKEYKVVKTKKFDFKPMSVEEAILQMNLLGHQFYVFTNSDTNSTSVVYKRKDRNYGLIEGI